MKRRNWIILCIVGMAIFACLGWGLYFRISAPRIVGSVVAPDGTEMCIVQQFNWSGEPFTTSFFYRRPGAPWGRFYFDHQDDYWSESKAEIDPKRGVAVFYRGSAPAVTFAWATETYTMHRWNRTITGAQWTMPPGWNPLSAN